MKSDPSKTAAVVSRSLIIASGLAGQVGCVTILFIGAALLGGLWLDERLGTRPWLTVLLILGSVPLSLALTIRMALSAIRQIEQAQREEPKKE